MGFHHFGQPGLELLTSGDPPTSASQVLDYRHEPPPQPISLFKMALQCSVEVLSSVSTFKKAVLGAGLVADTCNLSTLGD